MPITALTMRLVQSNYHVLFLYVRFTVWEGGGKEGILKFVCTSWINLIIFAGCHTVCVLPGSCSCYFTPFIKKTQALINDKDVFQDIV